MPATQIQLSTQQIQDLNTAERILHDLLPAIDSLEKCGSDCTNLRKENERIREQITKLQQLFGSLTPSIP